MASLAQGRVDLAPLVERIRAEFLALGFESAILNDDGEDNAVAILDDAWVFRFPRSPEAAGFAAGERRLLERLAPVSNLAVPRYELVAADGCFGGYRKIAGESLTPARFAACSSAVQRRLLDELGGFLQVLHGLPASLAEAGPRSWTGTDYAARYEARRETFASVLSPALLARADAFYAALPEAARADVRRLVHNDFTDDHILIAAEGDRIAGVIDFSDATNGDPAFDFTYLWAYADWAPDRAARAYADRALAPGLVERSLWWFARYSLDQLWWNAMGHRAYDTAAIKLQLARTFAVLGL